MAEGEAMSAQNRNVRLAWGLALAVSLIGLGLRIEHAITFDGPGRGADYAVNVHGVYWTVEHLRPFNFSRAVPDQLKYQPPAWFALGGILLKLTSSERSIAALAVVGWLIRQILLARMLWLSIPQAPTSALIALSISAFLPVSVLTDGKVNPEGLHTTLFMMAVYALWRLERELVLQRTAATGVGKLACAFGVFAGLAVLTKATGGVLPIILAVLLLWRAWTVRNDSDRQLVWKGLGRIGLVAFASWSAIAGFWCYPNLVKYHHPFPHIWNFTVRLPTPILYRRPLGWALPFEWSQYLRFPVIYVEGEPLANFWATSIAGMWSDMYNRGFCRLKGGEMATHVFGVNWGPTYGEKWYMPMRCVELHKHLVWIGLPVSLLASIAVIVALWRFVRSSGAEGSLVLPTAIALNVFFVMLFALVFPLDNAVVTNPRYLLPAAAPMCACLAWLLASLPGSYALRRTVHLIGLGVCAAIAALVIYERFGA
jgi:4-amino-4-deoxy-L-arabinose transferase-like glycosyltransferase